MALPVVNGMKTLSVVGDGTEQDLATLLAANNTPFPSTLNIAEVRLRSSVSWQYTSEAGGAYIDVAANAVEQFPLIIQSVMSGQTPVATGKILIKCNGTIQVTCYGNPQAGAV